MCESRHIDNLFLSEFLDSSSIIFSFLNNHTEAATQVIIKCKCSIGKPVDLHSGKTYIETSALVTNHLNCFEMHPKTISRKTEYF